MQGTAEHTTVPSRVSARDGGAMFIAGAVVGLVSGAVFFVATFFRWWSGGAEYQPDTAKTGGIVRSVIGGLVVLLAIAALVVSRRASRKHRKQLGWWIGALGAFLVLSMPALPDIYPLESTFDEHIQLPYVAFTVAKIAAWGIVVASALVLASSRKPYDAHVPVQDRHRVLIAGGVVALVAGLVSFASTFFRWWSNSNGYNASGHNGHGGTCGALASAGGCTYRYFDADAQGFYPAIGILLAMLGIAVLVVNRRASRRGRTWFGCCIGALGVLAAVVTPTIPDHEYSRVQQTHAAFWIANVAAWAAVAGGALLIVSARKAKDRGTNADTFDRAAVE